MRRRLSDGAWIRILDVAGALEGRAWMVPGTVTFELGDDLCPWNTGTWTLECGPLGTSCRPATADATVDLHLDVARAVGRPPGGTRLTTCVAAGLVEEQEPGAAAAADRLLSWPVAPWTVTYF